MEGKKMHTISNNVDSSSVEKYILNFFFLADPALFAS